MNEPRRDTARASQRGDPLVAAALRIVLSCCSPEMVILFGSRSWGIPRADSDLDLLVVADCGHRTRSLRRELRESLGTLAVPVDVHLVTSTELEAATPTSFLRGVASMGETVYIRDRETGAKKERAMRV